MTEDEKRLEMDTKYRTMLLVGYSEMCDITLDLTGLDEGQAVDAVLACIKRVILTAF